MTRVIAYVRSSRLTIVTLSVVVALYAWIGIGWVAGAVFVLTFMAVAPGVALCRLLGLAARTRRDNDHRGEFFGRRGAHRSDVVRARVDSGAWRRRARSVHVDSVRCGYRSRPLVKRIVGSFSSSKA